MNTHTQTHTYLILTCSRCRGGYSDRGWGGRHRCSSLRGSNRGCRCRGSRGRSSGGSYCSRDRRLEVGEGSHVCGVLYTHEHGVPHLDFHSLQGQYLIRNAGRSLLVIVSVCVMVLC